MADGERALREVKTWHARPYATMYIVGNLSKIRNIYAHILPYLVYIDKKVYN